MAPTALVTGSPPGAGRAIALRLAADGCWALIAGVIGATVVDDGGWMAC